MYESDLTDNAVTSPREIYKDDEEKKQVSSIPSRTENLWVILQTIYRIAKIIWKKLGVKKYTKKKLALLQHHLRGEKLTDLKKCKSIAYSVWSSWCKCWRWKNRVYRDYLLHNHQDTSSLKLESRKNWQKRHCLLLISCMIKNEGDEQKMGENLHISRI